MKQSMLFSAIGSILLATADSAVAEGVALPRNSPEAQGISSAGIRAFVEAADRQVNTMHTVKMIKSHGFDVVYEETDGGHTWLKWRDYLSEFAPLLFQGH